MLPVPPHIRTGVILTPELRFAWDEWNIRDPYMFVQAAIFEALEPLTNKACTALTIAIGEWICARFAPLDPDPIPLQFLEAAWAGVIHPAYCEYFETTDDEWRGPVRAPLAITVTIAADALFRLDADPIVAHRTCWMRNLARHVIDPHDRFDAWFAACVARLAQHHNKQKDPSIATASIFEDFPGQGLPVPREAFDLAVAYDATDAPQLLDRYLRSLDPRANPFLRSTEELSEVDGLPGPPYRYEP
jgi:hypothetical protein